jgi:S-layer homology domain
MLLFILLHIVHTVTFAQTETICYSSQECADGFICSTERGICNQAPGCKPGEFCPTVCTGTCVDNTAPFTVSVALHLKDIYFSKQCENCLEYLWIIIREGIDSPLAIDSQYSIELSEYNEKNATFSPISVAPQVLQNTARQIDGIYFTLPSTVQNSVFPAYRYFKLTIAYKNENFIWVLRTKNATATSSTAIEASIVNPSTDEFKKLLKPPTPAALQASTTFPDVERNSLLEEALNYLTARNIINGYPDGTFKPYNQVNRAEAAKFLLNSRYGLVSAKPQQLFPDVPQTAWYAPFVTFAHKQSIIIGYPDGTFKPAQTVNTAEFLKMINRTFETPVDLSYPYIDVLPTDWFSTYAGTAYTYQLFPQRVQYKLYPEMLLTRQEVAIAMYKMLIASE